MSVFAEITATVIVTIRTCFAEIRVVESGGLLRARGIVLWGKSPT